MEGIIKEQKMNSFLFSVNAVLPIVLIVVVGYILKRIHILDGGTARVMNKVVFKLLLPCMLFLNVYSIEGFEGMDLGYVWYSLIAILAVFFISMPIIMMATKDGAQRGSLMQAAFRSNNALIGVALATSLFGAEGGRVATVVCAFAIPLFNILAVVCLSVFAGGKFNLKKILLGIAKNPLIISIALGFVALGVRAIFVNFGINFRLTDLTPVYKVMTDLKNCATPVALIMLGADFELSAVPALKWQIVLGTVLRIIVVPGAVISIAYLIGGFGGAHFASFVALFASPVAVSTVPMAQEMGGDTKLAGQLVVWSTLFSAFTIFLITFILKEIGIFI